MRRLVWELLCNPKTLMLELWNTEWSITEAPKTFTAIMALLVVFCISTQVTLRLNTLNNMKAPVCHGRFTFSCWYNSPHCENVILEMVKLMIPSTPVKMHHCSWFPLGLPQLHQPNQETCNPSFLWQICTFSIHEYHLRVSLWHYL